MGLSAHKLLHDSEISPPPRHRHPPPPCTPSHRSSLATYELSKKQGELEALRQAPSLEARQRGLQAQIGTKLRLALEQVRGVRGNG